MEKKIFAYFLQISNHMWVDPDNSTKIWHAWDEWDENNNIDLKVFDDLVEFAADHGFNTLFLDVGDGVQLKSHPEIAAPDAWSIEFLKEKIAWIRSKGLEVIPKLNMSACHAVWQHEWRAKMLQPEYIDFCCDIIKEVAEIFDYPRFFHLGLDEETAEHQRRFGSTIVRNEIILNEHIPALFKAVRETGAQPIIFADMIWYDQERFFRLIDKDVICSNWNYSMFKEGPDQSIRITSFDILDKAGYKQLPCFSTYSSMKSVWNAFYYLTHHVNQDNVIGYMTIPWFNTTEENRYSLLDDAYRFSIYAKEYFPEQFQ